MNQVVASYKMMPNRCFSPTSMFSPKDTPCDALGYTCNGCEDWVCKKHSSRSDVAKRAYPGAKPTRSQCRTCAKQSPAISQPAETQSQPTQKVDTRTMSTEIEDETTTATTKPKRKTAAKKKAAKKPAAKKTDKKAANKKAVKKKTSKKKKA